jgi:hypothetical protein
MTETEWLTDTNSASIVRKVRFRPWRKRCLFTYTESSSRAAA